MKKGQILYHVAHPKVPAKVLDEKPKDLTGLYSRYILVEFEIPVTFQYGRPGAHKIWSCNQDIMFETTEEAIAANDPNWREKYPYNEMF